MIDNFPKKAAFRGHQVRQNMQTNSNEMVLKSKLPKKKFIFHDKIYHEIQSSYLPEVFRL